MYERPLCYRIRLQSYFTKTLQLTSDMNFDQFTPKSYPVNLIDKDWTQRKLYFLSPAKSVPDAIHDMEVFEDDVWIVTNPKSGTTWMQELVWLLMNDCNFEAALTKDLELRSPYLEFDYMMHRDVERALKPVQELESPRIIKSHLSLGLLPAQLWQNKAKVIYVFRDPKDAWISGYYHGVTIGFGYGTTLEQYMDELLEKEAARRDPVLHAYEFYQIRNEPWVYYTSFNRMKQDLRKVIDDLCKFLNKTVTEQQMERLLKHLSFEKMKKNPTTNHHWEYAQTHHPNKGKEVHNFTRSGKVGGHKEELKPEQIEKADHFIVERLEANQVTLEQLLLGVVVSTFLALSSLEEGPVCVICTRRSVGGGGSFFMGAVMVNRPSEDSDEVTESGLTSPDQEKQTELLAKDFRRRENISLRTGKLVTSGELTGDKAMLVLLLLMLALDNDKSVRNLDGNLVGGELLHIQNNLEFLAINVQRGARLLLLQAVGRSLPWTQITRAQNCGARVPDGRQEIVTLQTLSKVLIQEARAQKKEALVTGHAFVSRHRHLKLSLSLSVSVFVCGRVRVASASAAAVIVAVAERHVIRETGCENITKTAITKRNAMQKALPVTDLSLPRTGVGRCWLLVLVVLMALTTPLHANGADGHLTKRYSDQSVHGYMTERTCWWNEVCKEEFQNLFRCKCPQFSYCRSPGRYYNAYCSMTDTGYIWTQLAMGPVER
ncbi:uncharacterized protein LOC132788162 [Drosophila nasuta]|uniref:uncharacterized protein LOC132788162 n=1 Tax=Drosophila nasuta TaxID=42062 RepID=UPI00295F5444|nr:uncharacterized protein LOC132788162 [Drosophila nasuta]